MKNMQNNYEDFKKEVLKLTGIDPEKKLMKLRKKKESVFVLC